MKVSELMHQLSFFKPDVEISFIIDKLISGCSIYNKIAEISTFDAESNDPHLFVILNSTAKVGRINGVSC